jgi:hypothetical protein
VKIGDIRDLVPAERLEAWGADPDEIQRGDKAKAARFESRPHPFLVTKSVCQNAECDCRTVSLNFVELASWPLDRGAFHFTVNIAIDSWESTTDGDNPTETQPLLNEFRHGLTADLKAELRGDYDFVKGKARSAAAFTMSPEAVLSGELVPYNDVFSPGGSILSGGKAFAFRFDHGGANYLADDLYCINPGCHCRESHLVFLRTETPGLWGTIRGKAVAEALFRAKVRWRGKVEIEIEKPGYTESEAQTVFMALSAQKQDLKEKLKDRYKAMKEVGARLFGEKKGSKKKVKSGCRTIPPDSTRFDAPAMPPPSRGGAPGRNEPCPCGSGKKHKRCCGK